METLNFTIRQLSSTFLDFLNFLNRSIFHQFLGILLVSKFLSSVSVMAQRYESALNFVAL